MWQTSFSICRKAQKGPDSPWRNRTLVHHTSVRRESSVPCFLDAIQQAAARLRQSLSPLSSPASSTLLQDFPCHRGSTSSLLWWTDLSFQTAIRRRTLRGRGLPRAGWGPDCSQGRRRLWTWTCFPRPLSPSKKFMAFMANQTYLNVPRGLGSVSPPVKIIVLQDLKPAESFRSLWHKS